MTSANPLVSIEKLDAYLFKDGLTLDRYFIERASGADLICFIGLDGRHFDLIVDDEALYAKMLHRLLDLGAKVVG